MKMRLILHIGSDKTGTTSIQETLSRSRDNLAQEGILYPNLANDNNHNLLPIALSDERARQPRRLIHRYGNAQNILAVSRQAWRDMSQQVQHGSFHTVILSAEHFFGVAQPDRLMELVQEAIPGLNETRIVAYLRRPSSHFVARLQQKLKAQHALVTPERIIYSNYLAAWKKVGNLDLREFNQAKLHNGDVVQDFWNRELKDLPFSRVAASSTRQNRSLSAEGLYLLQRFRQSRYPQQEGVIFRDSDALLRRIMLAEQSNHENVSFTRLKLHKQIRDFVDYSTPDNEVLKSDFGFQFDFQKQDRIVDQASLQSPVEPSQLSDLVPINMQKVDLLARLLQTDKRISFFKRWLLNRKLRACLEQV